MKLKKLVAAAAIGLGLMGSANAVPVALELSLVIDVSGSISDTEYNTQRNGYATAFNDAAVQTGILSFAPAGGVVVNVIQFSDNAVQAIGWTLLNSVASINTFASSLGSMARLSSGSTDIQDGMLLAINSIASNIYTGARKVIDVSGDGIQNSDPACNLPSPYNGVCAATRAERDSAAAAGIRINGLAFEGDFGATGVTNFYNSNVVTSDGFTITATSINDFERAVIAKIGREITEVPEPGTLALLGLAMTGLVLIKRRKNA